MKKFILLAAILVLASPVFASDWSPATYTWAKFKVYDSLSTRTAYEQDFARDLAEKAMGYGPCEFRCSTQAKLQLLKYLRNRGVSADSRRSIIRLINSEAAHGGGAR